MLKREEGKRMKGLEQTRTRPAQTKPAHKERASSTWYKDAVPTANYSFAEVTGHEYRDAFPFDEVVGQMAPLKDPNPHLVLKDRAGTPRFVLGCKKEGNDFVVFAIQRKRTQYVDYGDKENDRKRWVRDAETEASKQFQQELGGTHPAEFLFCEFLLRRSKEISDGAKVYLSVGRPVVSTTKYQNQEIYGPLISRFFKSKMTDDGLNLRVELSLEKERVRAILGTK